MIKYQLVCSEGHEFEAWFRSSDDYDVQAERGVLECPHCGDGNIKKAIMAPAVKTGRARDRARDKEIAHRLRTVQAQVAEAAGRARDYVEKNFTYVGDKFPEEARRIHYGETEQASIYGKATAKEAQDLVEEGVGIAPLPEKPEEASKEPPLGAESTGPALPAAPVDKKKLN